MGLVETFLATYCHHEVVCDTATFFHVDLLNVFFFILKMLRYLVVKNKLLFWFLFCFCFVVICQSINACTFS